MHRHVFSQADHHKSIQIIQQVRMLQGVGIVVVIYTWFLHPTNKTKNSKACILNPKTQANLLSSIHQAKIKQKLSTIHNHPVTFHLCERGDWSPPTLTGKGNTGWSSTSIIIPVCNKNAMKALMLARICSSVDLLHRRDTFRASLVLQQRVLTHPNIRAPRAWKMGKVTKRWNKWRWKGEISEVGSGFNDLFMTIHPTHNNYGLYIYNFHCPLVILPFMLQRCREHMSQVLCIPRSDGRSAQSWMIALVSFASHVTS